MKYTILIFLLNCLAVVNTACAEPIHPMLTYPVPETPKDLTPTLYAWEAARTKIPASTDMVLLYGGGHQRTPYLWTQERMADYVTYTDPQQKTSWLFDSFLLLEIMDPGPSGANKKFANGYSYNEKPLESANQADWQQLIDYYFASETGIGALEASIAAASKTLGNPTHKRQVVMSIPEPIVYQTTDQQSTVYWGSIDGKALDFSNSNDRVKACQWFIDEVRAQFDRKNYQHVELGGFYWLAEKATDTRDILSPVAKYLDALKYSFNWIPYYNANGYNQWSQFGFHNAYLQPNYFFSTSVPESRLDAACQQALTNNMQMEIEFDDNALNSRGSASRLRDYMSAFKRHGIWAGRRLAYYQGSSSLRVLKSSSDPADKQLYHDFCQFVVSRPIRTAQ